MAKPKPIVPPPPPNFWELLDTDILERESLPEFKREDVVYPKKPKPSRVVDPHDLPNLGTRTLLRYLASARASGYDEYHPTGYGPRFVTIKAIKAELAKRPHVPSKREGSELRAKKAHRGHGKSKTGRPRERYDVFHGPVTGAEIAAARAKRS